MSNATTQGHSLGYSVDMKDLTLDRTYYLAKEGYKVTTNPFYTTLVTRIPKTTFNDKWAMPIVNGFTKDLEYKQLDLMLSENIASLTHFFNEQQRLLQQYELLKLLEN